MMNYILFRMSRSFCFIKNVGYLYIKNNMSRTNNLFKNTIFRIKFSFIIIKLFFDYSKNTKKEKDIYQYFFSNVNKLINIPYKLSTINKDFNFYNNFRETLIGDKYISKENKRILYSYKILIGNSIFNNYSQNTQLK